MLESAATRTREYVSGSSVGRGSSVTVHDAAYPDSTDHGCATASMGLDKLNPGYFAMVMATGIVSIASWLRGMHDIARVLLYLNALAYGVLWVLTLLRLTIYPRNFIRDLTDHKIGVGFFTMIAGTGVFGSQTLLMTHNVSLAFWLWVLTLVLWSVLVYTIFTAFTVKTEKPSLAQGINGGWLVAVVGTQSVAILAAQLGHYFPGSTELMIFLAAAFWLAGGMLYVWIIALIFYRYMFCVLKASDFTSPYWINMGAVAITTLAGATLILEGRDVPFVLDIMPFLKGFTLFYWAAATWWIPMLVVLGVWRYGYCGVRLRYDPLHWGGVFPLGMYTACTLLLARAMKLPFLMAIPRYFIFIALLAWGATLLGLLATWVQKARIFLHATRVGQ